MGFYAWSCQMLCEALDFYSCGHEKPTHFEKPSQGHCIADSAINQPPKILCNDA